MKSVRCPSCGVEDEEEREDVGGQAEVALPLGGASSTIRRDGDAAALREFLGWLMSKETQLEMPGAGEGPSGEGRPGSGRCGRCPSRGRRVAPRPLRGRDLACARPRRAHLPQRRARRLLVHGAIGDVARLVRPHDPTPAPDVVVADGGRASRAPCGAAGRARGSRGCVFHAFCQVKRYTTSRPRLQTGVELYGLRGTSCTWRPCTRPSSGSSATCSGAASGPTSSRTPQWSTAGGCTRTRG